MIEGILLLSGRIRAGKTTLAEGLSKRYGIPIFRTHDVIKRLKEKSQSGTRLAMQSDGESLDRSTNGRWVVQELSKWIEESDRGRFVIVDSVRTKDQVTAIREAYGAAVVHLHITAPEKVLEERFGSADDKAKEGGISYLEAKNNETEKQVERLAKVADAVIDTDPRRHTERAVEARAIGHLRARTGRDGGYVDVIVGGQYGSEGKGQIAAYLSREYDLLVRVGGPNAGHSVYAVPKPIKHHHLPSGTTKSRALLLLGPGAVIRVDKLFEEIAECGGVDAGRLLIDRKAMIILDQDIDKEDELAKRIGSTKQGVGAATSRRVMRGKDVQLARDIPKLQPYLCDAIDVIEEAFSKSQRVLLEGTQGTGLSLYHGEYPHVTSRDTTVAGCLSQAGIPPSRVRRVIMVCRSYPIRVESPQDGDSGYMAREINLETIAERSGKDLEELKKTERTTTTNKKRRIAEFDWEWFQKAVQLNGPTDIVLTFADYLLKDNENAKRIEQLSPDAIEMINEMERVAGVPVSMVTTGFNAHSVIDRRVW